MFGIGEKIYNFVLYLKRKMTRNRKPKKNPSYMLFIYGDFSEEIIVLSDNPDKGLFHFLDNNIPLVWTSWDI